MKLIEWTLQVLLSMVLIMAFYSVGPALETKFRPVYSKFKLIDADLIAPNKTRARFEFTKYQNCDPQGFGFFAGELGASAAQLSVRVRAVDGTRESPREPTPIGTQFSSWYEIEGITPEDLANTVYAVVYSRCHPFWTTRSEIFP